MKIFDYDFYHENRFGSADWADYETLKKKGFFRPSGLQLGYIGQDPLYVDNSGAVCTIAGAQSGKGRDVLLYNICRYRGSMLVHDPKGEQYAVSLMHQHKLGVKAYGINPFGLHGLPQHRINPLDILTPDSPTLYNDCQIIVENFISLSKTEPHFDLRAREWLKYIMLTIIQQKQTITLLDLHDAVNMIEGNPEAFFERIIKPMQEIDATGQANAVEIQTKQTNAIKEFTAIMGSLYNAFQFMQPALRDMLQGGDVSLSQLCDPKQPVKIFIMFPAEILGFAAPLIRLLFTVGMLYKQRSPNAPRVVYLVDEAGQLGNFPELQKSLTYGAGCGIRTWAVFQDIGQIKKNFGDYAVLYYQQKFYTIPIQTYLYNCRL